MKKTLGILLAVSSAVLVAACNKPTPQAETKPSAQVVDHHNSRIAVDWAGVYEGVLPCADCPGIEQKLTLEPSGTYQLDTRYIDRSPVETIKGNFTWNEAGSIIKLDKADFNQQYQVGENRLWMLDQAGERISGPLAEHFVLTKKQSN